VSERPTRVLHVITRLIRGGADENTVLTAERLDSRGYESWILAGRDSELDAFPAAVRARTRILPELVRDPDPFRDAVALAKLVRVLRKERWDLVHTHTAKAGFLGRLAARIAGVPHVVHTLHGVTFHEHVAAPLRALYVALERLAASRCDALITVGDDVRRKYLAEGIGREDQYVTIASGMDLRPFEAVRGDGGRARREVRAELDLAATDVVVGMVSRLEPRKGWIHLLEAVARLAPDFPALRLAAVGEGSQRREIEAAARRLGLTPRVRFTGYRPDVARVIAALDVAALTSLWEGLPRVLVQYSLLEKPVVTFDVEGAREVVDDGLSGYVVGARDEAALVDRLRRLVASPALRAEMGRRARERALGRWDAGLMVDRIAQVYDAVRHGHPPIDGLREGAPLAR
jgi:glycosyltransferase involved in cell wall biosynthesis